MLSDEHGFTGKETIVKDYVRERRLRLREMFVPLSHPPGHAQADFGEADAIIAGVKYRAHFFVMTLPHSDACFVAAYPAATTEAWLDGHNRAFVFFGGVPQSILYANDKCLVSRILSDGTRQRTRAFSGLQSHYLFEDRYGRPGKGNDKGNVEGVVGYARRNFMTPLPRFASWDAFNGHLEERCRNRQGNVLRGHRETIGERFVRDHEALMSPLPAPFDACDKQSTRVNSLSLVRYRGNDYSAPVAYGHQEVWVRGYVVPARPRKPRDKAKVEVSVQIVERWVLARLRNRRFFSLAELNQAIHEPIVDMKKEIVASTACPSKRRAPRRKTSVSGSSSNDPGWRSWTTVSSLMAYPSFVENGDSNIARIRRPHLIPSPTFDGAVKSRFLMRVGWVIIVHVYFTRPTDRRIV